MEKKTRILEEVMRRIFNNLGTGKTFLSMKKKGAIKGKIDKFNYINKNAWGKNIIDTWQTEEKRFQLI